MGNAPSSQSIRSGTSQRSRPGSFKNRRLSRAVSFYETPPGSLNLEQRPSLPSRPSESSVSQEKSESKQESPQISREDEQTDRVWRPGVYTLINAGSGTVLDLSGGDSRSIIGFPAHHGANQQWLFSQLGDGYTIRSVSSGLYLTIEQGVSEGSAVIATPFPVTWKVKAANEGGELFVRIFWPDETFSFDLANDTPGTKVQLAPYKSDEACQLWRVLEHENQPEIEESNSSDNAKDEMIVSGGPTETLVISEDKDCITTTRTTTVVTTVTTVTKTPRSFMS